MVIPFLVTKGPVRTRIQSRVVVPDPLPGNRVAILSHPDFHRHTQIVPVFFQYRRNLFPEELLRLFGSTADITGGIQHRLELWQSQTEGRIPRDRSSRSLTPSSCLTRRAAAIEWVRIRSWSSCRSPPV